MNILILHSSSGLYGASKILLQTIDIYANENSAITVILPEDGLLVSKLEERGVKVIIMAMGILRRKYYNPIGLINRLFTLIKAYFSLSKIIKTNKIDLVYSNTTAVLVGAFTAKLKGIKHIWHIHEIIASPKLFASFLGWAIKKMSHKTIAVSYAVKNHWDNINPSKEEKIVVIHNGIDGGNLNKGDRQKVRNELKLQDKDVLIGMIGRVHYWKGQSYFLDLAHKIKAELPNAKFLMVGDAFPGYEYLYDEINEKIEKLNLKEEVAQFRFRQDIPDIFAALDMFILPSILPDPFPTVILEAMHASKPIVATAQGGAMEMIQNNATGYHIPINDADKAIQIILPILTNQQKRMDFGIKGHQRVNQEFSVEKYSHKMNQVMEMI